MKQMTFAEINDLENGQQISALQGTVKKVFDQKSDVGQYGQWWLQSFILTDEHGVEIQCTWSCEDTVNELEGKTILIEAGRDKKDQLAGIKKEIKNKNGKRYETVKLDDRCTIRKMNGDKHDNATPKYHDRITPEGHADEIPPQTDPDWPEAPPERPNGNGGVTEARKHLMQSANLYNLCVSAVDKAIAPNMPTIAQTSEQFQAAVASLFIEASREVWWSGKIVKPSLIESMPTKPL